MRKLKPAQARIARVVDSMIAPVFAAARLLRSPKPAPPPSRILAIELWRLGDMVLVTPALQALRQRFPSAHISLLASPQSQILLEGQNVVDEILPWSAPWVEHRYRFLRWRWGSLFMQLREMRRRRIDVAIDFRGDFRDNLLMWLIGARRRVGFAFAGGKALLTDVVPAGADLHQSAQALDAVAVLGASRDIPRPRLWVSEGEAREAERWLERAGLSRARGPLVAIHPGARWEGRRWPSERFAQLADELARSARAQLILLGAEEDGPVLAEIAGQMRITCPVAQPALRQLVALVAACDLFIGLDSGPMHMATAVGTPVVGLFGPQRPEWFGPYGQGHEVAMGEVPCRPCDQVVCSRPQTSCMSLIPVHVVLSLARAQLERRTRRSHSGRPPVGADVEASR